MVLGMFAGCKKNDQTDAAATTGVPGDAAPSGDQTASSKDSYTFRDYTKQLGATWNPHAWKTTADKSIMQYLQTPLVQAVAPDTDSGSYQWAFKAATSIEDVTAANKGDLTKFKVTLPSGQSADQVEKGYVFEIKLNPDMKWQDGTAINADTYIYSLKQLLDPTMKNYRASSFFSSEAALAGAFTYANYLNKDVYQPVSYKNASGKIYMDTEAMGYAGYLDANSNAMPQYLSISDETIYNNTDMANLDAITARKMYQSNKVKFEQGEAQLKSEDEIKKIALELVDGATEKDIRKIKKDLDDGRWEYEVEIIYNKTEYELEINAVTGEVITWDKESIYD